MTGSYDSNRIGDRLKRIGVKAFDEALGVLSILTEGKHEITVRDLEMIGFADVYARLSSMTGSHICAAMHMDGDFEGEFTLIMQPSLAGWLLKCLNIPDELPDLSPRARKTLLEIAGICCGSFVTAISDYIDMYIRAGILSSQVDTLETLLADQAMKFLETDCDTLYARCDFSLPGDGHCGTILALPRMSSIERLNEVLASNKK